MGKHLTGKTAAFVAAVLFAAIPIAAGQETPAPTDGNGFDWQTLKPAELLWMAQNLAGDDPAEQAARQGIADHVTATYLAGGAVSRSFGCVQWKKLIESLGGDLSAERKAQWAVGIRAGYVQDPEGLAELATKAKREALAAALAALGDEAPVFAWMASSDQWQSWDANSLADLAVNLSKLGGEAGASRQALAQHVQERFLTDTAAIRTLGVEEWRRFALHLHGGLTDGARAQWQTKLRAAFLQDMTLLANKPAVENLIGALSALADPQAGDVAATFAETSTGWQSWQPEELIWLAGKLAAAEGTGKAGREAVAQHVAAKYFVDAAATKSLGGSQWGKLAQLLAKDLTDQDRSVWVAKIVEAFAGSPEAIAGLKRPQASALTGALTALGGKDERSALVIAMADQSTAWQEWDLKSLDWLLGALARSGEAAEASTLKVIEGIAAKHLASSESIRAIGLSDLAGLVRHRRKVLSDEQRSAWAGKLGEAYPAGSEALLSLKLPQLSSLCQSLAALGDRTDERVFSWAAGAESLETSEARGLAWIATRLARDRSGPAVAARKRILGVIEDKHLASTDAVRAIGIGSWAQLAGKFVENLSAESRSNWAEKLIGAFAGSEEATLNLSGTQVRQLASAMEHLGREKEGIDVAARNVSGSTAWQKWPIDQLAGVARLVAASDSELSRAARLRILGHVNDKYLASIDATGKLQTKHVATLMTSLAGVMSDGNRTSWLLQIQQAFVVGDEALGPMNVRKLRDLVRALTPLDRGKGVELAISWLKNTDAWKKARAAELASLATVAMKARADGCRDLVGEVEKTFLRRDAIKPLNWAECTDVWDLWVDLADLPKAKEWSLRIYDAAFGTEKGRLAADNDTLLRVSDFLSRVLLTGKGKGYPNYATALTNAAAVGRLNTHKWQNARSFADPLGTPEALQIVRDGLLDAEGHPRPVLAKTLAWAYKKHGGFQAWRAHVDREVANAAEGSDKKALWLLAKAHNETLVPSRFNVFRCKRWLNMALGSANSSGARIAVLADMADYHRWTHSSSTAVALLESVKNQFEGEDLAAVNAMQDVLRAK